MGLKIVFYKNTTEEINQVIKDGDFKEFNTKKPISLMLKNLFGITTTHEQSDLAINMMEVLGTFAREDYWIDQTSIAAKSHSQWHSSYVITDRVFEAEFLKKDGFFVLTNEEHKKEIEGFVDATITKDTNNEELIKELITKKPEVNN